MDEKKKSLANRIYQKVQQSFFDIMLDLLKEKTTGISTYKFNFILLL